MAREESVVIGGGITGLTCAFTLLKRGHEVTVIEPAALGGLIRTIHKDGFTLELGPNVLLSKPEILSLLEELSLSGEIEFPNVSNYKQMVWFNGAPCAVPKGPLQFLTTPLIPVLQKPRILRNLFARAIGKSLTSAASVHDALVKVFGEEVVRNIVDPALKGIYGGDIRKLRAASVFPGFFSSLTSGNSVIDYLRAKKGNGPRPKAFVLKRGMISLIEAIQEQLSQKSRIIKKNVTTIRRTSTGFEISLNDGEKVQAQNVYLSTAGAASAPLVQEISQELADRLETMSFAPIVVVHLATSDRKAVPKGSFGVLFPSELGSSMLGAMFNSELFPHTAPSDKHLITVCLGGRDNAAVLELSEFELAKLATDEVKAKLGIHEISVLSVTKWPRAIPQYEEEHGDLLELMKACEDANPGLYFVGADRGGIGVPDRIKAAMEI